MVKTCIARSQMQDAINQLNRPIVFIPTMGALHNGHGALINLALSLSNSVVVSAFINPLQFENMEDLQRYPRTSENDLAIAEQYGASLIWTPEYEDVYSDEIELVTAGRVGDSYEGATRKGHFDGVLTVVKKLFEIVKPEKAIFGEKDFQQLFLIKKMVKEFNLAVEIITHSVVRDETGLALSSRNIHLSDKGKNAASVIYKALKAADKNQNPGAELRKVLASEKLFVVDYAEIINEETFMPINEKENFSEIQKRAIIAGWIDGVRLIDTMAIQ